MAEESTTETTTEATEAEAVNEEVNEEESSIDIPEDFDPERAMKTILRLRDIEKEHKALLAEKEAEAAAKAEAEKTLEQKLTDAQARIAELEAQAATKDVRADFIAKATAQGINDPGLAYLAAKEEGLLGELDPKTGEVGDHDFTELGNRFPSFASADDEEEEGSGGFGGDGGVRGRRTKPTAKSVFNDSVRSSIRGL